MTRGCNFTYRLAEPRAESFIGKRALLPAYVSGDRCPGCGRKQWIVGRKLAECHWCGCAVPIASAA